MEQFTEETLQNGAALSTAPVSSGGFDAGEGWDSHYDLRAAGVDAVGRVPMPSQAKIDNFQRTMAKLLVDLDAADRKAREAQTPTDPQAEPGEVDMLAGRTPEELMSEVDEALKLKHEVMDSFRDALAKVCSNSPTRAQLGKLNEPTLMRFINFVGGLLNPEG